MSQLKILLLGPPRILLNEKPINIKRRKALALLAYLAVSRRSQSRETLATLLWPDARPGRAHANLRHLIWTLRQNGVSEWLEASHDNVEMASRDGLRVDVAEFRDRLAALGLDRYPHSEARAARIPGLSQTVGLYYDHFMSGFGLRDNVAFDEWQSRQEESLRYALAGALKMLVRLHELSGRYDAAIPYGRRWLSLDPLSEPVQRQLISLYIHAGQRAEALRLFQTSERRLEKELGLTPARETLALRDRILSTEGSESTGEAGSPKP